MTEADIQQYLSLKGIDIRYRNSAVDVTTHPWIAPLETIMDEQKTLEYRLDKLPSAYAAHIDTATEFIVVPTAGIVAPISTPMGIDREMLLQ